MTSVYVFLVLVGLFLVGVIAYIAKSWGTWTSKQKKYSVAGLAGLAAIVAMVGLVTQSTSMAFATPSELISLVEKGKVKFGDQVKIEGEIVSGSIKSSNFGNVTDFEIKDNKTKVKIHFEGVLPDNFKPGIKAVAIGSYNGKVFKTNDVKTRCPSKYEAAQEKKGK